MGSKQCSIGICCTESEPRTDSNMLKPNSAKIFQKMVKKLPCKGMYADKEFKKFQIAVWKIISQEAREVPYVYEKVSPNQDMASSQGRMKFAPYHLIKNDLIIRQQSAFQQICDKYSKFLSELFSFQVPIEQEAINRDKCVEDQSLRTDSYSQYNNISTITYDVTQSTHQRPFNKTSATGLDQSESHNFKQNRSCEVKKSLKNEKPKQISLQIQKFLEQHAGLGTMIAVQCDIIFSIFRLLIQQQYDSYINEVYNDSDTLCDREIFFQRLIQHFLLGQNHSLFYILDHAINSYYTDEDKRLKQVSVEGLKGSLDQSRTYPQTEHNLDRSLFPRSLESEQGLPMPYESSEDSQCNDNSFQQYCKPFMVDTIIEEEEEDYQDIITSYQQKQQNYFSTPQRQDILNFIKTSEQVVDKNKNPYYQTFPLIFRIIRAKFWKKFELIEKIDQLIVQIYMKYRSRSQIEKFYDTITAEDSKVEIFQYILQKFKQTHPNVDIDKQLYQPLRYMYEFNGVLTNEIQDVCCPAFVRFFGILNMYVTTET